MRERRHIQIGCTVAAACCLAVVLACGVGALAVQRSALALPDMDVRIGQLRFVAYTGTIRTTTCPAFRSCTDANIITTTQRFYDVWVAVRIKQPANRRDLGRRVLRLAIDPKPVRR
jgi:hypothetical protein